MMSKKNVYGIENELHLVEHIQKCLKLVLTHEFVKKKELTNEVLENILLDLKLRLAKNSKHNQTVKDWHFMKPELDMHI